jgi:hypothetical protein
MSTQSGAEAAIHVIEKARESWSGESPSGSERLGSDSPSLFRGVPGVGLLALRLAGTDAPRVLMATG